MSAAPASPDPYSSAPAVPPAVPPLRPAVPRPRYGPGPDKEGHDCLAEMAFDAEVASRLLEWMNKRGLHVCTTDAGLYQDYGKTTPALIAEWMGIDPARLAWDTSTRTALVRRSHLM